MQHRPPTLFSIPTLTIGWRGQECEILERPTSCAQEGQTNIAMKKCFGKNKDYNVTKLSLRLSKRHTPESVTFIRLCIMFTILTKCYHSFLSRLPIFTNGQQSRQVITFLAWSGANSLSITYDIIMGKVLSHAYRHTQVAQVLETVPPFT